MHQKKLGLISMFQVKLDLILQKYKKARNKKLGDTEMLNSNRTSFWEGTNLFKTQ